MKWFKILLQGDRMPLLNSFCEWQSNQNAGDDSNPGHWDLALLVSGLNMFATDSRGLLDILEKIMKYVKM